MLAKVTNRRLSSRQRRGFTLLEVLVVTAILVILAGLATFATVSYLEKAHVSEAKLKMSNIEKAISAYQVSNDGNWPSTLNDLIAPADGRPLLVGGQAAITDPWGKPFQFSIGQDNFGVTRALVTTTDEKGNPLQWPER